MLHPFNGIQPKVAEDVFIAPGAQVIGKVTLCRESSIWYNAVLRGDTDTITVGHGSNIQDGTIVHTDPGFPVQIGADVTVGHNCIIHGCGIGDQCLIGMGSTILSGAKVGPGCLVGAGSLITEGKEFPSGSVIMGRPAKVVRTVNEKDLRMLESGAVHYKERARQHAQSLSSV